MNAAQIEDIYELTPVQQGMLFHSLYESESERYVVQFRYTVHGAIDMMAFREAWKAILRRHAVLRSAFVWEEADKPLQIIFSDLDIPVRIEDWSELAPKEREERYQSFLIEDRKSGFPLAEPPLMRIALLKWSEDDHRLIWTTHHLLLDGWSLGIISREIFAYYEAYSNGRTLQLPPVRPFAAYIEWLHRQDEAAAQSFWEAELEPVTSSTKLYVDRSRGQEELHKHRPNEDEEMSIRLDAEDGTLLAAYARKNGLTLNTVVQGAWGFLMHAYSGETQVLFGSTVSGRPTELLGADEIVGMLINTLPVRVEIEPEQSAVEWLRRLQTRQARARQFEYAPLNKVQKWSRVPAGTALFDCIVVFQNHPVDDTLTERAKSVGIVDIDATVRTNYAMVLTVVPGAEMTMRLEYDRNRIGDDTAERLLTYMRDLLRWLATASPEAQVKHIPLSSVREREQLLNEWNRTEQELGGDCCVHELIEEHACRTPDAIAVAAGGEKLTFGELNRRADLLAIRLREAGVGPDVPVGIFMERTALMPVAVLGVLKAGGAYVPLDPTYPAERLAYLAGDCGAPVIVAEQAEPERLPGYAGRWLEVSSLETADAIEESIDGPSESSAPKAKSTNLAYMIYTSGSTGMPKGVMIEHRNAVNYIRWASGYYAVAEGAGAPVHSSLAFDLTVTSLLVPLASGRAVSLVPEAKRLEGLGEALAARPDFSLVKITPAHLGLLGTMVEPAQAPSGARALVIGGEQLMGEPLRWWRTNAPGTRLINEYGPTEATVGCCIYEVPHDEELSGPVPIGRPIANTSLYVLNETMQPVPIGVPGELYIGGAGVARGYWKRTELTMERFVNDPFGNEQGGKLYRTGDWVRYRPDGVLEYIGRMDDQVKVKGYRIELGEVEAGLSGCPGVRELAVAVREDASGEKRLVAYAVRESGAEAEPDWRAYAKGRLPEHMVPTAWVWLDALPLTVNGKVDREALPEPGAELEAGEVLSLRAEAPRNETEEKLAAIWSEVLGISGIGVNDNFFGLGGDSIYCIQIVAKAHQQGLFLSPNLVFDNPTIALLAERLQAEAAPADDYQEEEIASGPVKLTPIQKWFFERPGGIDPHHYNQAFMFDAVETIQRERLLTVFGRMLDQHDALRLRFVKTDGEWYGEYVSVDPADVCIRIDLSALPDEEAEQARLREAQRLQASFDIEQGPLIRAVIFEYGAGKASHILLIVHHLVIDGVSWRILFEDLNECLQQSEQGGEIKLPRKTASFQRWSEHLHAYTASSQELAAEADYWLAAEPGPSFAPLLDHPDGLNDEQSSSVISAWIGEEETQALLQDIPKARRIQTHELLLTALCLTLRQLTGQSRVCIELEGHGREELGQIVDVTRTVGWFTTTYPVTFELAASNDKDSAGIVKDTLRSVPNKGIGYGLLRYAHPDESIRAALNRGQNADVIFNYLGRFDSGSNSGAAFQYSSLDPGRTRSGRALRTHSLHFDALVLDGKLQILIAYSANQCREETMSRFADVYQSHLSSLIQTCLQEEAAEAQKPEDFPLADLKQNDLDSILAKLFQGGGNG